jgi:hypothetical protein
MESLPKEKQSAASFTLPSKKPDRLKFFLFLTLGLVILILIGEGIYWLKLNKEKRLFTKEVFEQTKTGSFSLEEEQKLKEGIISLSSTFVGGDKSAQIILDSLEEAKKYDPKKFPEHMEQYTYYTTISSALIGEYYASSGDPEKRNPEILKVLAQIREMARQNLSFNEENWKVDFVDSY